MISLMSKVRKFEFLPVVSQQMGNGSLDDPRSRRMEFYHVKSIYWTSHWNEKIHLYTWNPGKSHLKVWRYGIVYMISPLIVLHSKQFSKVGTPSSCKPCAGVSMAALVTSSFKTGTTSASVHVSSTHRTHRSWHRHFGNQFESSTPLGPEA